MARKLTQVILLTAMLAAPLALAACTNNEAEGPATDTTTVAPGMPAPMDTTTMMDTTMTDTMMMEMDTTGM
ncbi:MAG TPA: hypothetical protein VFG50_02270 [Rhodothermales bacterium]|nr:hypothetical protein [Rhodothermales bacterium]